MNLAQRLQTLMRWRGIRSQRQLARLSGVPQTSIHRILVDPAHSPRLCTVERLAAALGTAAVWLTHGNGSELPPHMETARPTRAARKGRGTAGVHAAPAAEGPPDRETAELHMLLSRLTVSERRKVAAVIRLIAERPARGTCTPAATARAGAEPRS